MKVLIIEDNETKLNTAKQILQKDFGITDIIHVNNLSNALYLCFRGQKKIDEFDLIILDLCFYKYKPSQINPYKDLSSDSGYRFLSYMVDRATKKDVIIFSSEENYLDGLKKLLFPSYNDFMMNKKSYFMSYSEEKKLYEKYIENQQKKLEEICFIVCGHAHNEYELHSQIKNWLENQEN